MSDKDLKLNNTDKPEQEAQLKLDDARRVKVLSPNQLVFKRFKRNRLAIIGSVIIILMFTFAYIGAWLNPYKQDQVFTEYVNMKQDYAIATKNTEFRYTVAPNSKFDSVAQARFIGAKANGETTFVSDNVEYSIKELSKTLSTINQMGVVASVDKASKEVTFKSESVDKAALAPLISTALSLSQTNFELKGEKYEIVQNKFDYSVLRNEPAAIATTMAFSAANEGDKLSFEMVYHANMAANDKKDTFEAEGKKYELKASKNGSSIYSVNGAEKVLLGDMSEYVVQSSQGTTFFIPLDLKIAIVDAINDGKKSFDFTIDNQAKTYVIERDDVRWTIRADRMVLSSKMYASPSWSHPLGTDNQGMDILVRLMYGGRVSLLIGFVVVMLASIFGIILGGISGYFGGVVDQLIMRIVDIFYCIPSLPIIIIIGASMDVLHVTGNQRMMLLMLVLGLLGWPSIARMIRGQILSLREQEYMLATEATGIRVSKRIFRHLVPNVMPLLIVMATMSIGGTILTESTLSFLGLGVKFPFASWGNIINAVSNDYVMTTYWFVWIPAGICILMTVLAFNFIGDGLRDAYDPKQKQ